MSLAKQRHAGVVAFDPRGMIAGVVVYGPEELEAAIDEQAWNDGPLVYRYDTLDANGEFSAVCSVLFPARFSVGGFAFIVDEAGMLQTANGINDDLLRIVKQHPTEPLEESVTVIQTNHRLAEFHGASKALMNELFIFQTTHPRDLQALEEHTGDPQIIEVVKALPRHHCVRYLYGRQADGVAQYQVWDKPELWYVSLKGDNAPPFTKAAESEPFDLWKEY